MSFSNKADLRLLEDMGASATPGAAAALRAKRPSLKAAGLAVVACIRMQRWSQAWAGERKVHEALVRKLDGMRRKGATGASR